MFTPQNGDHFEHFEIVLLLAWNIGYQKVTKNCVRKIIFHGDDVSDEVTWWGSICSPIVMPINEMLPGLYSLSDKTSYRQIS